MGHTPFPFTIYDTCKINGLPDGNGNANIEIICPKCNKKHFGISFTKGVAHCFGCGFTANALTLHAELNGLDNKAAYKDLCNKLEIKDFKAQKTYTPTNVSEGSSKMAPITVRNAVYKLIWKNTSLSKDHEKDLLERGMVDLKAYRTFDPKDSDRIIHILLDNKLEPYGIPGFYKDEKGNWKIAYHKRGIMVFYLDSYGKIQGFQIRKDNNLLKTKPDGKKEKKYTWFSSSYIPKGCSHGTKSKTYVHYACDFFKDENGNIKPLIKNHTIILTEGAMKADIAHQLSGDSYLALPGVACFNILEKELKTLKRLGVTTIKQGYDMDSETNENVQKALEKTKEMIKNEGFRYIRLHWKSEHNGQSIKGIDDYYAYMKKVND